MSKHTPGPSLFKTAVLGVGPFCIEFEDGEIITTRSKERQVLLAAAPELLGALEELVSAFGSVTPYAQSATYAKAQAAIAKAKGEA